MADAEVDGLAELVLLPEGAAFGSYVIHQCIGQGAMGNVYRAEHALLEKPVAIKVMDASLLSSGDARERFLREGQAAAAIKHPNVVDITDVGVFEGTPYLVMELLEGEDLQLYLQRQPQLSEREIAGLLLPIAAALGAAHDRGVVHRDLKPSNIFLSRGPDGEIVPKILDFGISKIAHALASADVQSTPFNQLMGSPLYLPPEAVRGSRDLTAKSDQYSLGVVLYECATGRAPFAGDSLLSILNSIAAGDFMKPSALRFDVSEVMERVILRAMNPDPALRYDHVRDLGRELLDVAGVRTQMLWGRSFGRLDLSEPPFGAATSTAPMALTRPAGAAGATPRKRSLRKVWLGVVAVMAISLTNFWDMRAPPERSPEAAAQRAPQTGEASLRPALDATQIPSAVARAPAPRTHASDAPSAATDAVSMRSVAPTPARETASPLKRPIASNLARSSAATQLTALGGPRELAAGNADRARPSRRVRPMLISEPRVQPRPMLVPEMRPRLVQSDELAPEPYADEIFPPMETQRDGSRPAGAPVATGANESPILD